MCLGRASIPRNYSRGSRCLLGPRPMCVAVVYASKPTESAFMSSAEILAALDGVHTGEPCFGRGRGHLGRGEVAHARGELTPRRRLDPRHPFAIVHRAEAYRRQGDVPRALADYDVAHELEPHNFRLLFHRGLLRLQVGQAQNALADFSECLRLEPGNAMAH